MKNRDCFKIFCILVCFFFQVFQYQSTKWDKTVSLFYFYISSKSFFKSFAKLITKIFHLFFIFTQNSFSYNLFLLVKWGWCMGRGCKTLMLIVDEIFVNLLEAFWYFSGIFSKNFLVFII